MYIVAHRTVRKRPPQKIKITFSVQLIPGGRPIQDTQIERCMNAEYRLDMLYNIFSCV